MLVFDTAALAPYERADAMVEAMLDATLSTHVVHADPRAARLRLEHWSLGSVDLTHVTSSGMDMTRTRRQADGSTAPVVAISLESRGGGLQEQYGASVGTPSDTLALVELTDPYRSRVLDGTDGWSVKIPLDQLAVPPETIAAARTRLPGSPVHEVFRQHLRALADGAHQLPLGHGSALLGTATIALARALICSAAEDSRLAPQALADSLLVRVQGHIRAHLHDPRLSPAAIAAAHHVSVRQLYQACADAGVRLEQWIIQERLEGARDELARPGVRRLTIAAVARRWGFSNSSHFTHRFRAAYGMTPSDWQALSASGR